MTRAELEARRFEAERLFQQGMIPNKVARALSVSRTSALRWRDRLSNGHGMKSTKTTGRPPRIDYQKLQELYESRAQYWTRHSFRAAIRAQFGIAYDGDHVYRLLVRCANGGAKV